ncbi:MAG: hypothetical protein A3C50_02005 [Candidatus Staskawiczbacteria bacterium RIFCSPHIGHO2_02_FULL_43_16]|nr:MAG: hypothetical protein A3C50_02005 [Candidatus Staskawiczbacteria bacterium RIFCSPHIGHO2_02_FULL_43_16]
MNTILQQLSTNNRKINKIEDLFSDGSQYGYTASANSKKIGPRFLRITDIQGNVVNWKTVPYCEISEKEKAKYLLKKNDLVFARTGATTGMSYFLDSDLTEDAVFASYLIRLRFDDHKCDPRFLKYFFQSKNYWGQVRGSLSGSAQPGINAVTLSKLEVRLPDLKTQKKITDILDAYDLKIKNNDHIISIVEKIANILFKEWFIKSQNKEGSDTVELRDIFSFVKGKKPIETSSEQRDDFLPQILIETFGNGARTFANTQGMTISDQNDLLMVMDGASSGRIEFGMTGVVGSTMAKLSFKKPIKAIVYFFLKTKEKDIKDGATGSAIPHTDKEKVYRYTLSLSKNIALYEKKLEAFIALMRQIQIENQKLTSMKDKLLGRLI